VFEVTVPVDEDAPTRLEMINQLQGALPKEWWWGSNMAEWGLKQIR